MCSGSITVGVGLAKVDGSGSRSVEETIERKRSHIKNVPLSSLSGIQKPGTPAGLN
jgi:hypothetical protein